jgi:hypothetical protein
MLVQRDLTRSPAGKDSDMRTTSLRLLGVLALGLLSHENAARAEFMDWSYNWGVGPRPVVASGTGTVAFALYRGGMGSTMLRAAAVTTSSAAPSQRPDRFASSFNLTLHLRDIPSHQSGELVFRGTITGTLTANSSNLIERFSLSTEKITLGGHTYVVTLFPSRFMLPRPGSPYVPQIDALVRVQNARLPIAYPLAEAVLRDAAIPSAPEPSALVLAGWGVVLLVCVSVWRCRRVLAAA